MEEVSFVSTAILLDKFSLALVFGFTPFSYYKTKTRVSEMMLDVVSGHQGIIVNTVLSVYLSKLLYQQLDIF